MEKKTYSTPQTKALRAFTLNDTMLVDWSAPDGTGGGNHPEADETSIFDGDNANHLSKTLWDTEAE